MVTQGCRAFDSADLPHTSSNVSRTRKQDQRQQVDAAVVLHN
jgi:hypothetical protein